MIKMIVGTPARVHIAVPDSKHSYSNGHSVVTVCGKFLADFPETQNRINFADRGFADDVVTCKNCRRTIAPSKVLFADDSTAVVGPGLTMGPVVPASPQIELRWNDDFWEIHVNFSDPASDPMVFMNGYEAAVSV